MPSLGHLLLGGMLGLFLYYISDKKFTKYHVFILFVNNYLGPDVGWVVDFGVLSHNVLGFCIIALPLAAMFSYITRFSPDFKRKDITDLNSSRVPFLNTYCLVVAGGTLHNYLDGIMNYGGHFYLTPPLGNVPGFSATIQDFMGLWVNGAIGFNTVFAAALGIPLLMAFIYYFTYFLKYTPNKALLGTAIYMAAFMVCFYFLGSSTTFHNEAGAIAYVSLFWCFPLGLCLLSVKIPVKDGAPVNLPVKLTETTLAGNVNHPPNTQVKERGVFFGKIIIIFFLVGGVVLALAGVGCLLLSDPIDQWIITQFTFLGSYVADLTNFVLVGGSFLIIGGLISILAGYKLKQGGPANFRFVLFHKWLFDSGFGSILLALICLTLVGPGVDDIFLNYGTTIGPYITQPQLVALVQGVGVLLLILGIINYVLGLGLLQRSERWRRATFLYNICWGWAILGLVFACYLSQNDVRSKFQSARNPLALD